MTVARWRAALATAVRRSGVTMALLLAAAGSAGQLSGCASVHDDAVAHANHLAATAGMRHEAIAAGPFVLTAYVRITRPDQPLTLYIEGDGVAWLTRYQPSPDPTPRRAIALQLAAADRGPNVAYLARPCQFTPMVRNAACAPAYWTGRRFGMDVVAAMDDAVDRLARQVPGQRLDLVGYSGGAAIAVLVAARRTDIASLRTVAGNLDTEWLNRLHGVASMPDSLNPVDVAARIASVPQWHLAGADDGVVPPEAARRFVRAQCGEAVPCLRRVRVVEGVGHEGDWVRVWEWRDRGR